MGSLEEIRREIEAAFASKGFQVVSASDNGVDYIIYLNIPKKEG